MIHNKEMEKDVVICRPKLGQMAIFGPLTFQIGRVSAVRGDGFYVHCKNAYPRVPGGREYGYSSVFFRFDQIGPWGHKNTPDDWRGDTAQVTLVGRETDSRSWAGEAKL